ncbi:TolC family outer membrane protein [Acidisphaera sp. L21]|uniref:TolC family outer membrane protein n=1 Tax=Acidisphaera sp. L21 TaxID=1641851 RepID=UPI00131D4041|nr:TolC family outer membrane protein [Acidisphaera sp. L21]
MQKRIATVFGLGMAWFATAASAQTQPHTLQEALAAAYSTNPTLLAARAALRAVDEGVPQALSGWRPQIVVSASYGGGAGTLQQSGPKVQTARESLSGQATLSQPIYNGGKTEAQTHSAENRVLSQRGRLIATEQLVFTNVITDYVNVIQTEQLLQLDLNNEQVLNRQLQATNDRFRVGEITRTDVAQAEAALAGARATRQTAEGNVQTARAAFQRDVGFLPSNLVVPQPLALPIKTAAEASRIAAANNPTLIYTMFDAAASKDAVDVAYSAILPTLSAQASAFRQDNTTFNNSRTIGAQALLNLSVPIYQGGAEYSGVRQARQTEQQSRKTVDDTRRQVIQSALSSWETLVAARSTIESTRSAIRANEIALEGTQREAIVGSRTTLDVLNAEQALLQSRVTLVQNLASLVTSSYNVAAALGRLTARDLNLNVPLYDDTAYYKAVHDRLFGTGDYALSQPGR